MSFWVQLRLLCWKNFITRRRQKKRFVIEIMWPLALFLIMMWVRTKQLKEYYHECHFEKKALISAGLIPTVQTFVCSLNNTCNLNTTEDETPLMKLYDDSVLTEFLLDFDQFVEKTLTPSNVKLIREFLIGVLKTVNTTAAENSSTTSVSSLIPILGEIFGTRNPITIFDNMNKIQKIGSALMDLVRKYRAKVQILMSVNDTRESVSQLLCGKENAMGGLDFNNKNRFEAYFQRREELTNVTLNINETSNKKCAAFLKLLSTGGEWGGFFWNFIKPLIQGKILYYPNKDGIRRVMERVNGSFQPILDIVVLTETWLNDISPVIKEAITSNSPLIKFALNSSVAGNVSSENRTEEILKELANIDLVMTNISSFLSCFEFNKIQAVNSEEELEEISSKLIASQTLWAAIEFVNGSDYSNDSLPSFIQYKIRMDAYRTSPTFVLRIPSLPSPKRNPISDLQFLYFGFAFIQDLIERSIIIEQTNTTTPAGFWMQQFPYPCHILDLFIVAIARSLPMFMTLAWVYSAAMIIKSIVYEKEKRLKEMMRMMGLGNTVHWVGWFLNSMAMMTITIILLTFILKLGNILENSNPLIIFIYLLFFAVATIALSFMLSTFFSHANLAAAAGGMIYFVWYLPYSLLIRWDNHLTTTMRQVASILSNVAFGYGCSYFAHIEETGVGVQWDNVAGNDDWPEFDYTLTDSMLILFFDAVIYFIIAVYVENVAPGQYGIPQPWYFLLQPRYWFPRKPLRHVGVTNNRRQEVSSNFEAEPTHLSVGISISDLRKVYRDGKVAVDNLSLNFYEGQITSFLGHNGAGKTTTISILTGLFPPTNGTAYINGIDIRVGMHLIRKQLGICPQHDILFDLLTVREHLWFYARLKGVTNLKSLNKEIEDMIDILGLTDKTNVRAHKLSGGMKRKLSIGIAFIGGSKVVILDEPTAGVDPSSRRSIWELLLKFKKGRTILLTTHFMDEADVLGDRIAIIANGKLKCCGTSLFLKKRFGKGYYLTVVKNDAKNVDVKERVQKLIKTHIPDYKLKEEVGYEIVFMLPSSDRNIANFKELFEGLESNKIQLGIDSYGITDTTLEEIFLNVCEENEENEAENTNVPEESHALLNEPNELIIKKVDKFRLVTQQFGALVIKRYYHTIRNLKALVAEIVLPALFVCVAFVMTIAIPPITSYPPMELHPHQGVKKNYIFFNEFNQSESGQSQRYVDFLVEPPHLGVICMNGNPLNKQCSDKEVDSSGLISSDYLKTNWSERCDCNYGTMTCPENSRIDAPTIELSSGDYLSNVTKFNVSDWLLKSHMQFYKNRFGGYSIGLENPTSGVKWCVARRAAFAVVEAVTGRVDNVTCVDQDANNVVVWFNNRQRSSSMAYLNAFNNLVLRANLPGEKDPFDFGISVINHPLQFTAVQALDNIRLRGGVTVLQAICVVFAMSFVPASFVLFLIGERISDFKHLQFVSGVKPYIYWISTFFWDLVVYLVSVILCIFLFLIFNDHGFTSENNFFPVCVLLFLYGWATIPLMYPFSFMFDVPSLAFVSLSCCNLFIGIVSTLATFMLEIIDDEELQEIGFVLKRVFLIFPQYCLGRGLIELKTHQLTIDALKDFGYVPKIHPFDWLFIGRNIFSLVVIGFLCFSLTLLIEYKFFCKQRIRAINFENLSLSDDEDVAKERRKVFSGNYDSAVLRVENLEKVYRTWTLKNFISKIFPRKKQPTNYLRAVNKICFAVEKGECFGLLGVNGAGKTTTFKMLTGDINVSGGNAYLLNHSILTEMNLVRQNIGYCPQSNAIDGMLTCEEHLRLFAILKGVGLTDVKETVDVTIKKLNLEEHRHRRADTYSGGNKRKLCTAIAFIATPSVVFLDEPTTGMDPKARRFLWDTILKFLRGGQSIILTSHSMEECEALCTRLAIMVAGQFKCIGSAQHLKNRFGGGYALIIRVRHAQLMPGVIEFVQTEFPLAVVKERHPSQVQLSVPQDNLVLSRLFGSMAEVKVQLGIVDYSITQTTLDRVFANFAIDEKVNGHVA